VLVDLLQGSKVHTVHARENGIQHPGGFTLLRLLKAHPLLELNVAGNPLGSADVIALLEAGREGQVGSLDITDCDSEGFVPRHLAAALELNRELRVVLTDAHPAIAASADLPLLLPYLPRVELHPSVIALMKPRRPRGRSRRE
jgi:hypothetical protein